MLDRILLDSCSLIWWASGNRRRLSAATRDIIGNPDAAVCLSSISIMEIATLATRRRIQLSEHWKSWLRRAVQSNGWDVLPVTWEVMEEAYSLPGEFHGDPADRILVATSRIHRLSIVTPDARIRKYPHVESVW